VRLCALCDWRLQLGACPAATTGARHDWREAQCVCGRRMGRRGRRGVAASLSPSNAAPVRACMPGRAPARHSGCDWREEEKGWGGWGDEGGGGSRSARPMQRRAGVHCDFASPTKAGGQRPYQTIVCCIENGQDHQVELVLPFCLQHYYGAALSNLFFHSGCRIILDAALCNRAQQTLTADFHPIPPIIC